MLLALSGLTACVTTTTGGFNTQASEEQALNDYIQLAIAYYDGDDMAGARRHLSNAMEIDRRNPEIYSIQALIFQREGDMDLAEENFRRAISLDRNNSRARNNYAAFLFNQNRFRDAYEQLLEVTTDVSYQGRAIAFENLGRAALRIDREDEAQRAFTRALQLNSNLYISALELAILLSADEQWPIARRYFQQYRTTAEFYDIPHTPRALLAGITIEGQFQNQELVESFALILATLYPDSPEFVLYQAMGSEN